MGGALNFLLLVLLFGSYTSVWSHWKPNPIDTLFEPEESGAGEKRACYPDPERMCRSNERNSGGFSGGFITLPVLAGSDSLRWITNRGGQNVGLHGYTDDASSLRGAYAVMTFEGNLDTAFNTAGIATHDFSAQDDLVHMVFPQNAGTFFVGRTLNTTPTHWLIGRYNGGSLNTSFYTSGYRAGTFHGGSEIFRAGAQAGARAYAVGYTFFHPRYDFLIAAYLTSGDLDTTFNTAGYRKNALSSNDNGALAIAMSTSGASQFINFPIAIGPVHNGANWDFGFVRYSTDGSLDTSFNTTGKKVIPILSSNDKPYSGHVSNGPNATRYLLVAGGYAYNGTDNDFALVRLVTTGTLDTTFSTDGIVTTDFFGADDVIFSLWVDPDYFANKTIAIGSADNGGNVDIAMARFESNGQLDTSFHTDGKVTFDIAGEKDVGASLLGQNINQVYIPYYIVGARTSQAANLNFALLRVETDGTLARNGRMSQSFGTNGSILTDLGGTERQNSLSWNAGNSYGGTGTGDNGSDIVIFQHIPRGLLNTSFHTDGVQTFDLGGTETIEHGFFDTSWTQVYAVGDNASDILVARFRNAVSGSSLAVLDTGFYTSGYQTLDISGSDKAYFMHANNNQLWTVGKDGGTPSNFLTIKLMTTGELNTAFSTDGWETYAPTGNAAVAKYGNFGNGAGDGYAAGEDTQDMIIIRTKSTGGLNTSFHTNGVKTIDFGGTETFGGADVISNLHEVVVGGNGSDFCIARLNTQGAYDTSFNTTGKLTLDFGTINEKAKDTFELIGGKRVVMGDDGTNFLIARLTTAGNLDTSFNTNGKQSFGLGGNSTAYRGVRTPAGDICIIGSTNGNSDAAIACVHQ